MNNTTATVGAKFLGFVEKSFDIETGVASFKFSDGDEISINVYELDEHTQQQLMGHGILQKGGDSYAGVRGDYARAKEALTAVIETLIAGDWTQYRKGTDGPRLGELAEAVALYQGWDVAKATETLRNMPKENIKKLRAAPQIKALIAKLRFEKAQREAAAATDTLDALF